MVFLQVFLAVLASFVVLFLLRVAFFRRLMRRHGRGRHPFALVRSLGLSREQRRAARAIMRETRRELRGLRLASWSDLGALMATERFDRGRAGEVADHHLANLAQVKPIVLAALERLHGLLDQSQRARVAAHLASPAA